MVNGSLLTRKQLFEEHHDLYIIYLEDMIYQMTGTTRTEQAMYNDEEYYILALYANEKAIQQDKQTKKSNSQIPKLTKPSMSSFRRR